MDSQCTWFIYVPFIPPWSLTNHLIDSQCTWFIEVPFIPPRSLTYHLIDSQCTWFIYVPFIPPRSLTDHLMDSQSSGSPCLRIKILIYNEYEIQKYDILVILIDFSSIFFAAWIHFIYHVENNTGTVFERKDIRKISRNFFVIFNIRTDPELLFHDTDNRSGSIPEWYESETLALAV